MNVQLFQFLHDRNPEARRLALNHLVGHTPAGSQYRPLFLAGIDSSENEVVRDLKLLCRDHPVCLCAFFSDAKPHESRQATAHDAFKALVNLSDSSVLAGPLSETNFLAFLVACILVSLLKCNDSG